MDPNFLHAKLGSDDESDEDYVPQANELSDDSNKKGKTLKMLCFFLGKKNKTNGVFDDEDEGQLTGIAGLKAMKKKKELEDLWASMQEEDDYYSKKKQ